MPSRFSDGDSHFYISLGSRVWFGGYDFCRCAPIEPAFDFPIRRWVKYMIVMRRVGGGGAAAFSSLTEGGI